MSKDYMERESRDSSFVDASRQYRGPERQDRSPAPTFEEEREVKSGEPVLDDKKNTITVNALFVFYGSQATTQLSKAIADEIATMYNAANGQVAVGGKTYKVVFKIRYQTVSESVAQMMAKANQSVAVNFIRVEKTNKSQGRSFHEIGENNGFYNTDDNLGTSTTAAHEAGHGFGLTHPSANTTEFNTTPLKKKEATSLMGQGQPGLMAPRGTFVDAPYRWNPKSSVFKIGSLLIHNGNGTTLNPAKRIVLQEEIEEIFKNVTFDSSGKGKIGIVTNYIYDFNGY